MSVQPPYSMLDRKIEDELMPFCKEYGVGILPYSPLADGFLSGKHRRGQPPVPGTRLAEDDRGMLTDGNFNLLEKLEKFAAERGHTVLQLALAWLTSDPSVSSVIAGARSPEQVAENARASGWHLTREELRRIDDLLNNRESS